MNKRDQIIQYGKQQGKSQAEIDKALAKYDASVAPTQSKETIGGDISTAFKGSVDYAKQGYEEAKGGLGERGPIQMTESGLKIGAGLVGAAFSPLAPVTKYIGQGIDYAANQISDVPAVQKFAQTKAGATTARVAEDVANTSALMSLRAGGKIGTATKSAVDATGKAVTGAGTGLGGVTKQVSGALKDIKPEMASVVNHQVSRALHLTDGDMSNFKSKIGVDIGELMSANNLIGENIESTLSNLKQFKDANYTAVRSEIASVPKAYRTSSVPRYTDSLKAIFDEVEGVRGLEKEAVQVENLLKRETVTLEDVQMVKEMLDEHFKLFKVTGDPKDATTKRGIVELRSDLKKFIEQEVKENSGADIAEMNKNVMASRSILDAAELRTPRGLKSYQLGVGDVTFLGLGSFAGGPITGIAALFLKKALEAPSVRLRIAKIVDGWSDAQKARAQAELGSGVIPNDFRKEIKIKHNGQRLGPDA